MSAKTNTGLVAYCRELIDKGARYWYGCWGQIGNAKLLSEKSKQYPKMLSSKRVEIAKERGDFGHPVTDCAGIIKGYLMRKNDSIPPDYDPTYDLSADGFFNVATEKGTIDTMPEIIGLGLYKKKHAGVYIGNGRVIEAKGFDYGVIEDDLTDTAWTHWYKIPWIDYAEQAEPVIVPDDPADDPVDDPVPADDADAIYIVQKGDTLTAIAKKFNTTVVQLVKQNNIKNPDVIVVGQKIIVRDAEPSDDQMIRTGTVATLKSPLNVRIVPNGRVIAQLAKGSTVKISGVNNGGWYKLAGRDGYVCADYIKF